jgi:hypothetical protein
LLQLRPRIRPLIGNQTVTTRPIVRPSISNKAEKILAVKQMFFHKRPFFYLFPFNGIENLKIIPEFYTYMHRIGKILHQGIAESAIKFRH